MTSEAVTREELRQFKKDVNALIRRGKIVRMKKKLKRGAKKAVTGIYRVELGTWKLYAHLKDHHRVFLAALKFVFGNIGALILAAFALYYAWKWYPYYGVVYYIIGLINGENRQHFLYHYVIPWAAYLTVIAIILIVLYFTVWDLIFPKLYLVKKDGEKLNIGRAYFYSPATQTVYANLDTFLNIFRPINSLKEIKVSNPKSVERGLNKAGELWVHAEGVVHLHDTTYAFTDEYVPQYEIRRDDIEKGADEQQSYVAYRMNFSLRYNPEINKSKYKSSIILLPAGVFDAVYRMPEESYRGILAELKDRIEDWETLNRDALTDEELQADLSQKLAPLLKEIYEHSRRLENKLPALKEKNDWFVEEMRKRNQVMDKDYFDENMSTRQIPLDLAKEYVTEVRAVIEGAEDMGVIEE